MVRIDDGDDVFMMRFGWVLFLVNLNFSYAQLENNISDHCKKIAAELFANVYSDTPFTSDVYLHEADLINGNPSDYRAKDISGDTTVELKTVVNDNILTVTITKKTKPSKLLSRVEYKLSNDCQTLDSIDQRGNSYDKTLPFMKLNADRCTELAKLIYQKDTRGSHCFSNLAFDFYDNQMKKDTFSPNWNSLSKKNKRSHFLQQLPQMMMNCQIMWESSKNIEGIIEENSEWKEYPNKPESFLDCDHTSIVDLFKFDGDTDLQLNTDKFFRNGRSKLCVKNSNDVKKYKNIELSKAMMKGLKCNFLNDLENNYQQSREAKLAALKSKARINYDSGLPAQKKYVSDQEEYTFDLINKESVKCSMDGESVRQCLVQTTEGYQLCISNDCETFPKFIDTSEADKVLKTCVEL
jgi:hypothetical protein